MSDKIFDSLKGVSLASSFKLQSEQPLDIRIVVQIKTDLDKIVDEYAAYEGMKVYVKNESSFYSYINSTWIKDLDSNDISEYYYSKQEVDEKLAELRELINHMNNNNDDTTNNYEYDADNETLIIKSGATYNSADNSITINSGTVSNETLILNNTSNNDDNDDTTNNYEYDATNETLMFKSGATYNSDDNSITINSGTVSNETLLL